VIEDAF